MNCNVDTRQFLDAAFPTELVNAYETWVLAHPHSFTKEGESVEYFKKYGGSTRCLRGEPKAWYLCISTAAISDKVRTRKQDIRHCFLIVFDDIGTKSAEPPVEPSYKLETSKGNYQWGYFIDPFDVSDTAGQQYVDDVLVAAADAGFNDPGCRNPTRLVRVPGSLHRSGFIARIDAWYPKRSWALEDLVAELGLSVRRRRLKNRVGVGLTSLALSDVRDPIYDWLKGEGAVLGSNDAWVYIECPWSETHTVQSGASATAYSPDGYGLIGRQFRCLHGHCSGRTVGDFLSEVQRRGGPVVADATRVRDFSSALSALACIGE